MESEQDDFDKINQILNDTHSAICTGTVEGFKDLVKAMHTIKNKELLRTHYKYSGTEIIRLICKYNRNKHLSYLLHESHILHYLTSETIHEDNQLKEDAFYYAMCSNNFETLEILYDYWSGDLHWLGHKKEYDKFDVDNLNKLNGLLKLAFKRYEDFFKSRKKLNLQNVLNIESLMAFNGFQRELYGKLNDLKANLITWEDEPEDIIRIQETYAIKNMIVAMFGIYEKHSLKEKNMFESSVFELNEMIAESFSDTSTLINKTSLFVMYEVFYRKLDYNFCLLILDNLHLLKLRLSMPKESYQKIENKLYYFIYHLSSNWNFYLPRRKKIQSINVSGTFKGTDHIISINYDANREDNVNHIIYLERRDFERVMQCFKKELQNRSIEENIRKTTFKLPNEDNNCLMLLPHLRDYYSLKRITQHIAQLHSINVKYEKRYAFLLIERTLQVVGEFLKCTDESLHMQETTEALVKAEISVEVVNDLKSLRNVLCHAKNGELLKRIEVEENSTDIFDLILRELLYVKKKIDEVIKVQKPIMERDLTQNSMRILRNRLDEMPEMVANVYYPVLKTINDIRIDFIRSNVEKTFYENTWARHQYSKSLMKEVSILAEHSTKLELKYDRAIKNIYKNVIRKTSFYRERIKDSLKSIISHIEKWQEIIKKIKNSISTVNFLDYPNEEDANRIKSYSNKVFIEGDFFIQIINVHDLFANVEHHWKFIENLLQFIVHKTRIFNHTIEELKWSFFSVKLQNLLKYSFKSKDMEKNVIDYLDMMEEKVKCMVQSSKKNQWVIGDSNPTIEQQEKMSEFTGIKKFTYKLMMANFLTQEEKKHLISTLNKINYKNDLKKCQSIELMINKIETDTAIPKKEYKKFTESIELETKSQSILMNLVMGYKRNPLLPVCFSKRVFILRDITKQQTVNQLVLRYKLDKTFHVLLEVLLFDVFIILEQNKNNEVMKKSSKLLSEINLRNILTHGSPLLEVVGNVLDSNDLPTELIAKALDFIHDKRSIDALYALSELNFDFTQINNATLNPEQKDLLKEFKSSSRWKDYLQLVPEYKKNIYEKHKKLHVIDENSMALLKAVNKKDSRLVQESIDTGGNVNFVDSHKKAVAHYAAMKGSVEVLGILLKNRVDINIRNKENNLTALHYSAMNNFKDSVKFLLDNGADCFALDDKGRTPVYWAGQRNHVDVCRILVQAMKKCN